MDSRACPCMKSELDLFTVPPVQLAIDESSFVEIHPLAALSDKAPLEFYISGNGEQYIDLAHSLLHLQLKIKKKNGSSLAATDKVAPINYLLNTAFSECTVTLNDKQVSSQANYAYRCILDALIFSPKSVQNSMLTSSFFYKDTASKHDFTDPLANPPNNGLKHRYEISKESKVVDLLGPLHFDLATQPKLLVNGVSVRIKLERCKDSFALMSASTDFKLVLQHASLFLRKVKVAPSIMLGHETALSKGVIKIPIHRTEIKTFALSSGIQSATISNAFIGQLPTRLIMGLVSNNAFNGDFTKNPFNFAHYELSYISVLDGNRTIPSKPYQPRFDFPNSYSRSYISLFTDTGRYHKDQDINISYEDYKSGYTLYAFDLTQDFNSSEMHTSILRNGNLSVDVKFGKSLPETVNLIVYAEYRNNIEIDKARGIYTDY